MKSLSFLLLILIIILTGCTNYQIKYKVNAEDSGDFFLEALNESYLVGERVIIKTPIVAIADLDLYLNDEYVCSQTLIVNQGKPSHLEFYFVMPDCDVKLTFKDNKKPGDEDIKQIIYYDNPLAATWYNIIFNYKEDETTYNRHKDFIEKSGLDQLENESIFYYKNSAYIFIVFTPEQDTLEVQEFIYGLKRKYSTIISIEREFEYNTSEIYMHNPLYYGFEESEKIPFEASNEKYLSKGIYTNVQQIKEELDSYFEHKPWYTKEQKDSLYNAIYAIYNEDYFEHNLLVVTDTIVTGSGSNRQAVDSVYLKDNVLYLFVKMTFANIGTCDMQYTVFGVTIDKNLIENIETLQQVLFSHK